MRTRIRHGFTLVELLVVMSIIAMLAGLLLPAVNSVREVGRRTQCTNNQRNLALATIQYDSGANRLPGWSEPLMPHASVTTTSTSTITYPERVSWVFAILPQLERGDIVRLARDTNSQAYNKRPASWNTTVGGVPRLTLLACPNDSTATAGTNMSYVCNGGFRDRAPADISEGLVGAQAWDTPGGANATTNLNADGPNSAVFLAQYPNSTTIPSQTLSNVSSGDGTAYTLMFSENVNAVTWDMSGTDGTRESAVAFCFANSLTADATNKLKINAVLTGTNARAPGANSYHPNGVVVAFCDAHTAFVTADTDWATWSMLFTPRGDGALVPSGKPDGSDFVFRGRVLGNIRF